MSVFGNHWLAVRQNFVRIAGNAGARVQRDLTFAWDNRRRAYSWLKSQSASLRLPSGTVDSWVAANFERRLLVHSLNIVVFLAFSFFVLRHNRPLVAHGLDGGFFRHMMSLQETWWPFGLGITVNPLQGLFDIFHPHNLNLEPAIVLHRLTGEPSDVSSFFLWYGLEAFLSAALLARIIGMGDRVAVVAGWIFAVIAIPYIRPWSFYPVVALDPTAINLVLASVLFLWGLQQVRASLSLISAIGAITVVLIPGYMIAVNPTLLMITIPFIGLLSCCLIYDANSWSDRAAKAAVGVAALICLAAFQFIQFGLGIIMHTAPYFFLDELRTVSTGLFVMSVFYQRGVYSLGFYVVLASLAGCLLGALYTVAQRRQYAIRQGVVTCLFLAFGLLVALTIGGWSGPTPLYFEIPFWALYAIFIALLMIVAANLVVHILTAPWTRSSGNWKKIFDPKWIPAGVVAGIAVAVVTTLSKPAPPLSYPFPPAPTAITERLQKEIAAIPGHPWRGAVASFTGFSGDPGGLDWLRLHGKDSELLASVKNDHRLVGLWTSGIPTLVEYNQALSPELHLMVSRFLTRPVDRQIRNIVILTNIDIPYLRSLGVSYVITDRAIELDGAILRERITTSAPEQLFLYELPGANTGNYSPTQSVLATTAEEGLAKLKADFNFRTQVVANEPIPERLVEARNVRLTPYPGRIDLQADSSGNSVLLLPVQFSRCWTFSGDHASPPPTLFRANLMQLGVAFSGNLRGSLNFRFGPFGSASCRLQDVAELKAMKISGR